MWVVAGLANRQNYRPMDQTVTVGERYFGFAGVGHGGYTSGLVSALVGGPTEVTIRQPIPLSQELHVQRMTHGRLQLRSNGTVILQGAPVAPRREVPEPISFDEAVAASQRFAGLRTNPSPKCLCCGPGRPEGEGLRVFAGPVEGRTDVVGAGWVPHANFANGDGGVREEFVWAALDCPGAWALAHSRPGELRGLVTVRITGEVLGPVVAGERHVVLAWAMSSRRRLLDCAAAVFTADGELRAHATAIWVQAPGRGPRASEITPASGEPLPL
jgi:hypothetical protein